MRDSRISFSRLVSSEQRRRGDAERVARIAKMYEQQEREQAERERLEYEERRKQREEKAAAERERAERLNAQARAAVAARK